MRPARANTSCCLSRASSPSSPNFSSTQETACSLRKSLGKRGTLASSMSQALLTRFLMTSLRSSRAAKLSSIGMKYAACEDLEPSLTTGFLFFSRCSTEFSRADPALAACGSIPAPSCHPRLRKECYGIPFSGERQYFRCSREGRALCRARFTGLNCARFCVYTNEFRRSCMFRRSAFFPRTVPCRNIPLPFLAATAPAWWLQ